jgi:A/G-specific adenine glycosylase
MEFSILLGQWYEENKRDLPWRGESDPYKIWVSEIILQQTRVNQGWNYYLRFIEHFPTIKALAETPIEEVLKVWQGLGYYSRARNMHFTAQLVMNEHGGRFPHDYQQIRALKGIGDYTAAAVASIAFRLPYPAVDGNVLRFVCRLMGIRDNIMLGSTKQRVTEHCRHLMADMDPGTFNQAMMEFGATCCTPQNPQCEDCPFKEQCYAYQNQLTDTLPIIIKNVKIKKRYFNYLFFVHHQKTLIEQRTGNDIWKNLFQLPLVECSSTAFDIEQYLAEHHIRYSAVKQVLALKHQLTHQTIFIKFYQIDCEELPILFPQAFPIPIKDLPNYAVARPTEELLKRLNEEG